MLSFESQCKSNGLRVIDKLFRSSRAPLLPSCHDIILEPSGENGFAVNLTSLNVLQQLFKLQCLPSGCLVITIFVILGTIVVFIL